MASLYTQKENNITRTILLFGVFFASVFLIGWIFSTIYGDRGIMYLALIFSLVSSVGSYWFSDKIALTISHAVPAKREKNEMLYDTVENLCITAGLPAPRIYITEEQQINAFATGRNPKNAVIAVTRGALTRLTKTELEGVLAHELSHIGNRDILVSTVAVVLAGTMTVLARSMFWGGGRGQSRENNKAGGIFAVLGLILIILAPIGAMLLRFAISRRRESLADATGALLTRYPEGLASALQKIGADGTQMATANDATAHMWIANPFRGGAMSFVHKLFLTHPPIEERIKALKSLSV